MLEHLGLIHHQHGRLGITAAPQPRCAGPLLVASFSVGTALVTRGALAL